MLAAYAEGIQGEGLGGAGVAYPKDSLALANNPASALFLGGRFDAGVDYFRLDRGAAISGNNFGYNGSFDANSRRDFLIPSVGYVTQVSPDLALGIAAYGSGAFSSAYNRTPFTPSHAGAGGASFEQLIVAPTAAYQIAPDHSIGVSLNLGYQRMTVKGVPYAAYSISPANVTNNGVDEEFGIGARIGYLGHVTPRLSVGVTYQTETYFEPFKAYSGVFPDHGGFDFPQNVSVGAAYKLTPLLDVTAEYEFINFSSVGSMGNPGLSGLFSGQKLGSNGGPGFNWRDVNVIRIGANYQLTPQLQLRGGYAYSTEGIRDSETFLNMMTLFTIQNQFTAGFTWESSSRRWEYSGYLLYAPSEKVEGPIPAAFGGGNTALKMSEFAAGLSVGYKFDQPQSFKD